MKRTIVDGWETDKALEEATALGLTNENAEAVLRRADSAAKALTGHRSDTPTL
jgi:hypothetical protein